MCFQLTPESQNCAPLLKRELQAYVNQFEIGQPLSDANLGCVWQKLTEY